MYSNVIWDFNGTIIDDVDIGLNALNALLSKYGYKEIHDKDYYRSILLKVKPNIKAISLYLIILPFSGFSSIPVYFFHIS